MRGVIDKVTILLEDIPETRNSDDLLFAEYSSEVLSVTEKNQLINILRKLRATGDIGYESVTRARREAVKRNPSLKGNATVHKGRKRQENKFYNFYRGEK